MSNARGRDWSLYVSDMAIFAENVLQYTAGMTQSQFVADRKTFDATVRNLELIGEAAGRVPEPVRAANSHIPWRQIIATRNRLIHGYLGIDNDTLWNIITVDVPEMIEGLRMLRSS
jgi:uncharacterized protein with HEPN domain